MIKQCTTLSGFKASGTNYCWRRGYVEGPCIADMLVNVQLRLETNASFFTLIALPKTAFIVSPSCMFQPTNFPATNLPTSCIQLYVIFITACEGRHSVTFRRFRSNPCETMPYSLVHAAGGKNREGRFWEGCCGQIVVMSELRSWQFLVIATYLLRVANHLLKYVQLLVVWTGDGFIRMSTSI